MDVLAILEGFEGKLWTKLEDACLNGDHEAVKAVCDKLSDEVSEKTDLRVEYAHEEFKERGLRIAVEHGHARCCQVLIDAGADIDAHDANGRTPLMLCRTIQEVDLLLRHGANVHARDRPSRWTALHYCTLNIYTRDKDIVRSLLSAGAAANAEDSMGRTPLALMMQFRASSGDTRDLLYVAIELVKGGASVNTTDGGGRSLLHLCSGWWPNEASFNPVPFIEELVGAGAQINATDENRRTPLFTAVSCKNQRAGKILLELGADPSTVDNEGCTPLAAACKKKHAGLQSLLVQFGGNEANAGKREETAIMLDAAQNGNTLLIRKLATSGINIEARRADGSTALMLAAEHEHTQTAEEIIHLGANVNAHTADGNTALLLAAKRGKKETVHLLVKRGADVNSVNNAENTALLLAMKNDKTETAAELMGTDTKVTDKDHMTPAVKASNTHIVSELVKHGANVQACDSNRNTALHLAVMNGQMDMLSLLVELGVDANARNADGNTALHLAVMKNHTRLVSQLVTLGADPNVPNATRNSALHVAVMGKHVEMASQLIALGADTNMRNADWQTALHLADMNDDANMISQLIIARSETIAPGKDDKTSARHSPAMNTQEPISFQAIKDFGLTLDHETALHLAAKEGYAHTVSELVKAGASTEVRDTHWNTPLHLAASNGWTEVVSKLVINGANINAKNMDGDTPLLLSIKNNHTQIFLKLINLGANLDKRNEKCHTALFLAVKSNLIHMARELCRSGANLEVSDADRNTPLHLAINIGHEKMVCELVAAGANVHARNKNGDSALLLAVKSDFTAAALKMLEAETNVEVRDSDGDSPLSVAAYRGNGRLLCELVQHGAKVDSTISFFASLRNAVKFDDVNVLDRLVQIGASVNEHDENGSTILHLAVRSLWLNAVKWIIEHGGDVSSPTPSGWTPLHSAVQPFNQNRQKQVAVIKMLLENGADPTSVTDRAQTPLDIARERGNFLVTSLLEKAQLAQELIRASGEARRPDFVAIRFGGPPGAGKSTLTQALRVTRLQGYFRYESQADEGAENAFQRTKGINCQTFINQESAHFKIFDLGGHGEFLATHQMFIGDGSVPTIDCVVVSALDEQLEENVFKWCSLFASRNQPTATLWPLLLIASRADTATQLQQRAVIAVYHKVKQAFADHFRFPGDKPLFVDARKSWGELTVRLRQLLNQLHQELVTDDNSPRQPAICQRITEHLPALRKTTSSPVISKETLVDFMLPRIGLEDKEQVQINTTSLTSLFDKALRYLSGYASVLTFSHPLAQRHVVINPEWLLSDIVGRLMAEHPLPGPYVLYDNGYAKTSDVVAALETEHLPGEEALEMVADLGFCLEQKCADTVLNPSKLLGYRCDKHWCQDPVMTVNAGRRLKCNGSVAIASAFFPHLQVHFYHRYLSDFDEKLPMWTGGIRLVAGERSPVEALIESHPANMSIDIIVRGREGSERECSELVHSLTEETIQKASEISPGSQLYLFFLSKLELDELSPAGLESRPLVEYSEERVLRAVQRGNYVTDGNASRPESPDDLLLPRHFLEQRSTLDSDLQPGRPLTQTLSTQDWRVVLMRVARSISTFDACRRLAEGLHLNERGEDVVEEIVQVNPHRRPSDVAFSLFHLWLQRNGCQLTTEQRQEALSGVFRADLRRSALCNILDDELRRVSDQLDENE